VCNDRCLELLVQANKSNQRLEGKVLDDYLHALGQILPEKEGELRTTKNFQVHQYINRHRLARLIYITYILVRYGKGDLPNPMA